MFGFIGVGGTLGSIVGSAATAALAPRIGALNLLLVSAALLELAVYHGRCDSRCAAGGATPMAARRRRSREQRRRSAEACGRVSRSVLESPYLLGDLRLHAAVHDRIDVPVLRAEPTSWAVLRRSRQRARRCWRSSSWRRRCSTVLTQIFFTGRIIRWLGLGVDAGAASGCSASSASVRLGAIPVFATLAVFTVLRRARQLRADQSRDGSVVHGREARRQVQSEEHHRDVRVPRRRPVGRVDLRGFDGAGFESRLGISFVAIPLSAIFLWLGLWLGRKQAELADEIGSGGPTPPATGGIRGGRRKLSWLCQDDDAHHGVVVSIQIDEIAAEVRDELNRRSDETKWRR